MLLLRVRLQGILLEGQQASELTRSTAYLTANAGMTKDAANRATQWLTNLSEQIAEPSLWRKLLTCLILLLLLLL